MGKKPLSFLEQADALERENKRLNESLNTYKKLADTIVKMELGMDIKTVKKALENSGDSHNDEIIFAKKISDYFYLYTSTDMEDFLRVMLSSSSLNYFNKARYKSDEVEAGE